MMGWVPTIRYLGGVRANPVLSWITEVQSHLSPVPCNVGSVGPKSLPGFRTLWWRRTPVLGSDVLCQRLLWIQLFFKKNSFVFTYLVFIGVELIYNVVLVSDVQ